MIYGLLSSLCNAALLEPVFQSFGCSVLRPLAPVICSNKV
jgi:hypothetical protein